MKEPIVIDGVYYCEKCRMHTTHRRTVYSDAEYRTCSRCKLHTTWEPSPEHRMLLTGSSTPQKPAEEEKRPGRPKKRGGLFRHGKQGADDSE